MRLRLAFEINQLTPRAGPTVRVPFGAQRLHAPAPHVAGNQPSVQRPQLARQELQRFGRFERRHQTDRRAEHACRVTGLFEHRREAGRFDQARQASRFARPDRMHNSVTAYRRRVDPGPSGFDRVVIQQKPGLEIVRAVQNQIGAGEQLSDVARRQVRYHAGNLDLGVELAQLGFGRHRLRPCLPGILFIKQRLPLQIRRFHKIAVNHPQPSHPGARQ